MNLQYEHQFETLGSDDSYFPQGLQYAVSTSLNGGDADLLAAQAFVSSIDELTNVLSQQLKSTEEDEQQKAQATAKEQKQFSSEKIIKKLKMQFEEREQLEGVIRLSLGEAERFFTFDNQTLDRIPKVVEKLENQLRSGKKYSYTKFLNKREAVISFPTCMGLPLAFEYESPSLIKIEAELKMHNEPKISNGENLRAPKSIKAEAELSAIISSKVQGSLSFITPFNHQQHYVGHDRNTHFYLPVKAEVEINVEEQELKVEIEAMESKDDTDVVHYSSWPYIAQQDILQLEPVSESDNHKIVRDDDVNRFEATVGKQSTGMAFQIEYESEDDLPNRRWVLEQIHSADSISTLMSPLYDDNLEYSSLNITYKGRKSSCQKVQIRLKYHSEEYSEEERPEKPVNWAQIPKQQQKERLQHLIDASASKINSASVDAVFAEVEFSGDQKHYYTASGVYARSPVDKNSRVLAQLNRKSSNSQVPPFEVTLDSRGNTPNTNGLDYQFAKDFDPTTTNDIHLTFGETFQNSAKFNLKVKLSQSKERKQFLHETAEAQQCLKDAQEGNTQLPTCANVTAEANLLDDIQVEIDYRQVGPESRRYIKQTYQFASHMFYEYLEENDVDMSALGEQGHLNAAIEFEPDFSSVNVSFDAKNLIIRAVEIPLSDLEQEIYVIHPVFSVYDRVFGELHKNQVYWRKLIIPFQFSTSLLTF